MTQTAYQPSLLPWATLSRARRLMRTGLDLYETAGALQVRSRDLDYSLWRTIGETF